MSYTQEQIDRANQVSLEQFLRSQGEELVKSGREYRWKNHDSLTVKGNKWFRHSQSKGGYPIDFVMEFYNKTFPEAMQMLIGEEAIEIAAEPTQKTEFKLPTRNESNARMMKYLTEERKLPKDLVEEFIANGLIYEDAKHHNVVFVGKDINGIPRYAHCRGTSDEFRMDVAGSDKSYGFCYRGKGTELYVFEAPIDLLSHIALYPVGWEEHSYLSLGGVSPKALERFLSERKDIESVFIATDNDEAGNNAAEKLAELIPQEISVYRFLPQAKDWNEDLINERNGLPTDDYVTIGVRKPKEIPRSVPMICMNDVEQTEVDWLWYPYIPFGKLTIVQGNPGEGKTFFAMQLAAACTNQKFLPDMEPFEPFNMIFQTAEDQLQRTAQMQYVIEEPKTDKGIRYVPMTEAVAACFRRIIANRKTPKVEPMVEGYAGFLFLDKNDMPMVALHWEKYLEHIIQKYNRIYRIQMPKVTPHVCRHTFCSNMAKSGMNPKTLQYIMCHADISVTLNTYTHVNFDDAKEEVYRIANS